MNSLHPQHANVLQNRYGLRVAARLSAGAAELPHDITERLRASRARAIARRKQPVVAPRVRTASTIFRQGNTATLSFGEDVLGLWGRVTSAALVIALAAGLVAIDIVQGEDRASEVAEVDAALLTDDLPPAAYADPGFLQFLKSASSQQSSAQPISQ